MNQASRSGTKRSGAHLSGLQSHLDPKRAHKSTSHCPQRRPTAHYEVSSFIHSFSIFRLVLSDSDSVNNSSQKSFV